MRISDLLGAEVHDIEGRPVGKVDDLKLVRLDEGEATSSPIRVEGLIIGNGGLAVRLGYHRHGVRGPWLLKAIAGRLERKSARYISWDEVETVKDGRVQLKIPAAALRAV